MTTPNLTTVHAKQAIIDGVFPTHTVKLFNISFTFEFTDAQFPLTAGREQLRFLERVISYKHLIGKRFIRALPPAVYYALVRAFLRFQSSAGRMLLDAADAFFDTPESRNYWEIFKASRPELAIHITDGQFNLFQRKWILVNTQKDKKDMSNLIVQIFDAVKPWLNPDLYKRVQEVEENRRDNVFYDEDNMAAVDAQIREKARRAVAAQQQDDDNDEILIDGE